jgi:hypothetical protein
MEPLDAGEIEWEAQPAGSDIEPPPAEQIDIGFVLTALRTFVRRYVVLDENQLTAFVLWVAHTHAFEAADCTPYLHLASATPRCGKTRAQEVAETVVRDPWLTGHASVAVLVRRIERQVPTLLLDEDDAEFRGPAE